MVAQEHDERVVQQVGRVADHTGPRQGPAPPAGPPARRLQVGPDEPGPQQPFDQRPHALPRRELQPTAVAVVDEDPHQHDDRGCDQRTDTTGASEHDRVAHDHPANEHADDELVEAADDRPVADVADVARVEPGAHQPQHVHHQQHADQVDRTGRAQEPDQEREDQVEGELDADRPQQRTERAEVGHRQRRGGVQGQVRDDPARAVRLRCRVDRDDEHQQVHRADAQQPVAHERPVANVTPAAQHAVREDEPAEHHEQRDRGVPFGDQRRQRVARPRPVALLELLHPVVHDDQQGGQPAQVIDADDVLHVLAAHGSAGAGHRTATVLTASSSRRDPPVQQGSAPRRRARPGGARRASAPRPPSP